MAGTVPDAWKEVCKIAIIPEGGTAIQFHGMTEDITAMDWGEKDIEGMPLVNGGRVVKFTPMTDESMTLKVYPTRADADATDSIAPLFHVGTDTTQPIAVDNNVSRQKFGIIVLWAETLPTNANDIPAADKAAYRVQAINAYMTAYKPDFSDKILSAEITFKWAPFKKDASSNKREESTEGTSQLPAAITSATSFA